MLRRAGSRTPCHPRDSNYRGKSLALSKRFRCPGNQLQRQEDQSEPHEDASALPHIARRALQECSAACDRKKGISQGRSSDRTCLHNQRGARTRARDQRRTGREHAAGGQIRWPEPRQRYRFAGASVPARPGTGGSRDCHEHSSAVAPAHGAVGALDTRAHPEGRPEQECHGSRETLALKENSTGWPLPRSPPGSPRSVLISQTNLEVGRIHLRSVHVPALLRKRSNSFGRSV